MASKIMKSMDPQEIQKRFSSEQYSFTVMRESRFKLEDFKPFIDRLPQREVDLIEMYYRGNKKQKEIGEFFGVTQGAVSHRLNRAKKRLMFLRDMPKVPNFAQLLKPHFTEFDIDVVVTMINTTCQSETADILNDKYKLSGDAKMNQVKIRHKFLKMKEKVLKLRETNTDLNVCYELIDYVKRNLYMLHEVILPHFDKGYKVRYHSIS